MKKVKVLAIAFVIGSATLFAHNPLNKQIPPNTNKSSEADALVKKQKPMKGSILNDNTNNLNNHLVISFQERKKMLNDNKIAAIKNYTQFMPDIVGKE